MVVYTCIYVYNLPMTSARIASDKNLAPKGRPLRKETMKQSMYASLPPDPSTKKYNTLVQAIVNDHASHVLRLPTHLSIRAHNGIESTAAKRTSTTLTAITFSDLHQSRTNPRASLASMSLQISMYSGCTTYLNAVCNA